MSDLIVQFGDEVRGMNQMHHKMMQGGLEYLDSDEIGRLEFLIRYLLSQGLEIKYLADCYLEVVRDTLTEQIFFLRNGRYRFATYQEVAAAFDARPEYMRRYMYGLALTSYIWPNHTEIFRFFERHLPRDRGGAYLEIGPGHGLYMATALQVSSYASFLGIDISGESIQQTGAITRHFAPDRAGAVDLRVCDFLESRDLPEQGFSMIVAGELLEHVERPERFLARMERLLSPGGTVFVSTCVNSPAFDHIYLWRSPASFEDMIREAGFQIVERLVLPYPGTTIEVSEEKGLSMNLAYFLGRAEC